jgi:hypothetical protein
MGGNQSKKYTNNCICCNSDIIYMFVYEYKKREAISKLIYNIYCDADNRISFMCVSVPEMESHDRTVGYRLENNDSVCLECFKSGKHLKTIKE